MCELLGMSANVPTDICFSFTGLMQRGGKTAEHADGWGIAFYEGKGVRDFRDPCASVDSEIARFLQNYPIKSHIVISHIRKANSGKVCLENTHPFQRELWGRAWTFAHNGQLKGIKRQPLRFYTPIGSTDSEYAFCWMLDEIRQRFPARPKRPQTLWRVMREVCDQLHTHGVFNLLMSDSVYLYAYCSTKLYWITRRAPFGQARLKDADMTVDFSQVTTQKDVVTIIATVPLTDNENWVAMQKSELQVFEDGDHLLPIGTQQKTKKARLKDGAPKR